MPPTNASPPLPEDGLADVVAKLRRRAFVAGVRGWILLIALIIAVFAGLAYYLLLPFWEQAADTRAQVQNDTIAAINAESAKLNEERATLVDRLAEALTLTALPVETGTVEELRSLLQLIDGSVLAAGERGTLLHAAEKDGPFTAVEVGTKADLYSLLQLSDGTVLVAGSDGTMLRAPDGDGPFIAMETGTAENLYSLLQLTDGSVMAAGASGTLLRAPEGDGPFEAVETGIDAAVFSLLQLTDGTVLAAGSSGTLLRAPKSNAPFAAVQTGTDSALYPLVQLTNGTVLVAEVDGTLLRISNGVGPFATIETGTSEDLYSLVQLAEGLIIAAGSGGTLLSAPASDRPFTAVETGTNVTLFSLLQLANASVLAAGENGTLLDIGPRHLEAVLALNFARTIETAAEDDRQITALLSELPDYTRTGPAVAAIERELALLIAKRSVLDLQRQVSLDEIARIDDVPWEMFRLEQQRETFQNFMTTCRGAIPAGDATIGAVTEACATAWRAQQEAEGGSWWRVFSDTVPPGVLLLFLLATLGGLYRYNLRLAGFHNSRADALILLSAAPSRGFVDELTALSVSLAADKVEFGKAAMPSDQATQIATALAGKVTK